jgi:hypothetical protein
MPWDNIIYQNRAVEMRDSLVIDLFEIFAKTAVDFIAQEPKPLQADWLSEATREWQQDCLLPPGCILIKLDKWLG